MIIPATMAITVVLFINTFYHKHTLAVTHKEETTVVFAIFSLFAMIQDVFRCSLVAKRTSRCALAQQLKANM